ncbi:FxsA family protein [Tatumella ptyseos]|uniref:FxsA family protein n=1 Tax=Tatumella ptyseos TaxID=82987 RepID=UPI0026F0CF53|nr:FxsA family protein [Tatumella ptyseos]WKX26119.1 FxsA family protein [Tatumella ptyseos]
MRWLPFIALFILAWIEISLFIKVAHLFGVLLTLLLVIATSAIGLSLVKNQGIKNFRLMQEKLVRNENPAPEMTRGLSLFLAGFLLILPGFFTDFLGALLLLPPVQQRLTHKLMPFITVWGGRGQTTQDTGYTMEGEFERHEEKRLDHRGNSTSTHKTE